MSLFSEEISPKIKPFLELMKKENLFELEIENKKFLFSAKREKKTIQHVIAKNLEEEKKQTIIPITSNLVGKLHLSDPKTGKPLLYEELEVTVGQLLCLIETMNLMNEVRSPYEGVVKKILGSEGDLVEYGRPLLMLAIKDGKESSGV